MVTILGCDELTLSKNAPESERFLLFNMGEEEEEDSGGSNTNSVGEDSPEGGKKEFLFD